MTLGRIEGLNNGGKLLILSLNCDSRSLFCSVPASLTHSFSLSPSFFTALAVDSFTKCTHLINKCAMFTCPLFTFKVMAYASPREDRRKKEEEKSTNTHDARDNIVTYNKILTQKCHLIVSCQQNFYTLSQT